MGHEGTEKTLHRLRQDFFIPGLKGLVRKWVRDCPRCQQNKVEHLHPSGLLQPLALPDRVWSDISMDFIDGFPKVQGKSVILTVVDRFSKYAHFIPLAHPYTATSVASVFFREIVRLHGLPESIVSDRDPVFTSAFWKDLFSFSGVKLHMSSAFHPQSDGQSEVVNRTIEMYLRCLAVDRSRQWLRWLPWAEYCYNTSFHSALRATPFEVVYGRSPPSLTSYLPEASLLPAIDHQLQDRDVFLQQIRGRLAEAQVRMKLQYDKGHRDIEFQIGDWVWVRFARRTASTITPARLTKLSPKFYGPYQVLDRIGSVAYRLDLPPRSRIYNVFHVGYLKPFHGPPPTQPPPLPSLFHGHVLPTPSAILRSRLARGICELLVHWQDTSPADATWMPLSDFQARFPLFQLEDKLSLQEGSNVMDSFTGIPYRRRQRPMLQTH